MKNLKFVLGLFFIVMLFFMISCQKESPLEISTQDISPNNSLISENRVNSKQIELRSPEQTLFQGEVQKLKSGEISPMSFKCGVIGPKCAFSKQVLTYTYSTTVLSPNITWTIVSGNISIEDGQGTNTITLKFGSNFQGGYVTVVGAGKSDCSVTFEIIACSEIPVDNCKYHLGILDEYIDGTQSGANFVYLNAGGNFPSETTYTWTIKRQNNSTQFYPPSINNPRKISTSINNRITQATVTAEYLDCVKTVSKFFRCAIPNSDINGDLFPECD